MIYNNNKKNYSHTFVKVKKNIRKKIVEKKDNNTESIQKRTTKCTTIYAKVVVGKDGRRPEITIVLKDGLRK